MMKLVSKVAPPTLMLTGGLVLAQPSPGSASPDTVVGAEHMFPHAPTIPADMGELEAPDNPVPEQVIEPGLRAWLERFGHISSMRLIARLARMMETRPQHVWNGKNSPPGSKPANERSRNTFGHGR